MLLAYALLSNAGKCPSVNRFLQMRQAIVQAEQNVNDDKATNDDNDSEPRHSREAELLGCGGDGGDRDG